MKSYLVKSELRVLGLLNRYRRGLTWSELLEKSGFSRSTLNRALNKLRGLGFISKAIRDDDQVVYRAEVTLCALDSLDIFGDFIDYKVIADAVRRMDKDAFVDAVWDVFRVLCAAFVTEVELAAISSSDAEEFRGRVQERFQGYIRALSNSLQRVLDILISNSEVSHNLLREEWVKD